MSVTLTFDFLTGESRLDVPPSLEIYAKKSTYYTLIVKKEEMIFFIMVGIFVYSNKIGVQKSVLLDFTENSA